jgi:hypothetical protein
MSRILISVQIKWFQDGREDLQMKDLENSDVREVPEMVRNDSWLTEYEYRRCEINETNSDKRHEHEESLCQNAAKIFWHLAKNYEKRNFLRSFSKTVGENW